MKLICGFSVLFLLISCTTPTPTVCINSSLPAGIISLQDTVSFDGSCSEDAKTYEWNFGDGSMASGIYVSHRYLKEGVFTVTLKVVNGKKNDSGSIVFSVQK